MAIPILMPKLGLTMETGTVVSWRKHEGDHVQKGEALVEVETDKIVTEVQAPEAGVLLKVLVPEGGEAKVQAVLAVTGEPGEDISVFLGAAKPGITAGPGAASAPAGSPSAGGAAAGQSAEGAASARQRITPRARKLLEDNGFSATALEGTGKGKISEADVLEFLQKVKAGAGGGQAGSPEGGTRAPLPGGAAPGAGTPEAVDGELVPMGRIEKVVAARMTESFRDVPQFSLRFSAVCDKALSFLPQLAAKAGVDISINDLILRAVALAISRVPEVQYQARPGGIFKPSRINVGFAVALGRDLVVPVIRDARTKHLAEIAQESARLVARAKEHRLAAEDVSGGTFTVSNLGMFGITSFVPIVNPGEGAILGVGALQSVVRPGGSSFISVKAVELTLVCDHRSVNGAIGAGFCRELARVIQEEDIGSW